jgi:hypothetical protein
VCILTSYSLITTSYNDDANLGYENLFVVSVITQLLINISYTIDFVLRLRLREYRYNPPLTVKESLMAHLVAELRWRARDAGDQCGDACGLLAALLRGHLAANDAVLHFGVLAATVERHVALHQGAIFV